MEQTFDYWEFLQENTLSFLFTTFILGAVVELVRSFWRYISTLQYRGWHLVVDPADPERPEYRHAILWEEIQRFASSRFEKRKFIQSVVTSEGGWLEAGQIDTSDPDNWIYEDKENKTFKFNMAKLPPRKKP